MVALIILNVNSPRMSCGNVDQRSCGHIVIRPLARDVALLKEKGYRVQSAQAADLFPRCSHVETVVLLSREKADDYVRISVHTKDLKTGE